MASESDAGNSHEHKIKACRLAEKNDSDENNLVKPGKKKVEIKKKKWQNDNNNNNNNNKLP